MSWKKTFLFNAIFTLIINLLIKPIWVFGIDRTVQNRLGEAEYGLYFAIFNFTYLFQIFLDFGLQNYNQTEIAGDKNSIRQLLPGMLMVKMVLSLSYIVLVTAIGIWMGYASEDFFPWLLLNQILLSLIIFLRSNISANRQFIRDAWLSISDKIVMIVLCTLMLSGSIPQLELSLMNFVLIQTVAFSFTTVLALVSVGKLHSGFDWKPDFNYLKVILRQSLPFAIVYFLMTLYYRLDTVMVEQMLGANGAGEAGIYAQSYRIMESVNNLGYLMAGVLLPLFAYKLGTKSSFFQELRHGYGLMLTMTVPIVAGGFCFAQEIIGGLYPSDDASYSATIFQLLLLNFFPVALLYVFGPLLTANRSFRWMISSLVVAVILNIGLNYWLIPTQGALGASIATLSTQILMLASYTIALRKIFEIPFHKILLLKSILFTVIMIGISFFIGQSKINWMMGLGIIGLVSLPISFGLGIISKDSFRLKIEV